MRKANNVILNLPGYFSTAAIAYYLELEQYSGLDGQITISDCARTINLDFSVYERDGKYYDIDESLKTFANNLHKAIVLQSMIQEFIDNYEEMKDKFIDELKARNEKIKENENESDKS